MPLRCLLSDSFAAERRALITDRGHNARARRRLPAAGTSPSAAEGPSTTHLTVADKRGFVVSYTFTIESTGGNGIVVPGYGFLLNNELTDFDLRSTTAPNRADGGKRPRSSMAPTIITRDGRPVLAVGSPGGSMIITTVLQVLVERLELGRRCRRRSPRRAPSQRNTRDVDRRAGVRAPRRRRCMARGHAFGAAAAEIGAVTGIEFLGRDRFLAAAEPVRRGGGSAAVARVAGSGPGQPGEVLEHRQQGAGVVDHGVRVRQRLDRVRAGGDRRHAHAVGPRAGDVARRVADHDRPLARPAAGARPCDPRQPARDAWSDAKPPCPGSK